MTFVLDNMEESGVTSGTVDESNDSSPPVADSHDKTPERDWRLYNVIVLGFSFMLIFTAFMTCSMAEVGIPA